MPQVMTTPYNLLIIFFPLIISSLLTTQTLAFSTFISCSHGNNFTSPSPYASNLHLLLSNLISTTPKTQNLFFVQTVASAGTPKAFGLAQCRLDASPSVCANCLSVSAASAVNVSCSGQMSASVRNEYCVLRYAERLFLSVLENPRFFSHPRIAAASNPAAFSQQVGDFLAGLLPDAVKSTSRFAADVKTIDMEGIYKKIYGFAWCTMDLSPEDCYQCLDQSVKTYEGCCADKLGGESMTVSCIVAFNDFAFFNPSLIHDDSHPNTTAVTRRHSQIKKIILTASISVSIFSSLIAVFIIIMICHRRKLALQKIYELDAKKHDRTPESHIIPFLSLKAATNNFSDENKLGEGRFGPVYKGVLSDGRQIVVKRLSKTSGQGLVELRNEAVLVAQLQHKNLVKLLGCYMQEEEKLLVYEYLSNASLDKHLYDPAGRAQLDWKRRHMIIEGIARGLVYLHNHSRLRIIHRDLNASNILLDSDMNPKISDFGLAKLVGINESQWNTMQIAGTFGYMAPEYAIRGLFSTKSDVFSYGMVVLEIITGRRNGSFIEFGTSLNLQTYVWQHWNQGKAEKIIDQVLGGQDQQEEVLRCINIGLLCIQADPVERPSMASVVLMLSTNTEMLPAPSLPAYFTGENPTSVSSESSTSSGGTNYDLHSIVHYSREASMNEVSLDLMQAR